ncbi:MAG TPA: NAD(P)-dependent oxidoreductase, partial [Rhizomicrobium sp.]
MSETIGFIGLGRMGSRMCARLIDAGHALTVYDVDEANVAALVARGAARVPSPKAVADAAELVFASLPSPAIVQEVAAGVTGGSRIRTFVDLSTTGPRVTAIVATALAAKNIVMLDAPVSGGIGGAAQGTLAVMVSGPRASYDRIEGILKTFGKLFFMGEKPGLGQTMKLANNLLSACAITITSEALVMGTKAGLDPAVMLDVINAGSGRNTA